MEEKEKDLREIAAICSVIVNAIIFFLPYPNDLVLWIASSVIFIFSIGLIWLFYYKNFDFEIFQIIMSSSRSLVMIFFSLLYTFVSIFVSGANCLQVLSWLICVSLIVFLDCQKELIPRKTVPVYFFLFLCVNIENFMVIYGFIPGIVSNGVLSNIVSHETETELRRSSIINILQLIILSLIHYSRQTKYRNVPKDYYSKEIDYLMVVTSIVRIPNEKEDKKLKSSQKMFMKGKSIILKKLGSGESQNSSASVPARPMSEVNLWAMPYGSLSLRNGDAEANSTTQNSNAEIEAVPLSATYKKKVKDIWLIRYRGMLVKIFCVIMAICFVAREFTSCLTPGGILLSTIMMACQYPVMILLGYKNIDYRIAKIIFSVQYSKIGLLSVAVIIFVSGCTFQMVSRIQNNNLSDVRVGVPYCFYEDLMSILGIINGFLVALLLDTLKSQFLMTKRIVVVFIFLGLAYQWYLLRSGKLLFNQYFKFPGSVEVFSYNGIMTAAVENCVVTAFITAVSMLRDRKGLLISFASARVNRSSKKIDNSKSRPDIQEEDEEIINFEISNTETNDPKSLEMVTVNNSPNTSETTMIKNPSPKNNKHSPNNSRNNSPSNKSFSMKTLSASPKIGESRQLSSRWDNSGEDKSRRPPSPSYSPPSPSSEKVKLHKRIQSINPLHSNIKFASLTLETLEEAQKKEALLNLNLDHEKPHWFVPVNINEGKSDHDGLKK